MKLASLFGYSSLALLAGVLLCVWLAPADVEAQGLGDYSAPPPESVKRKPPPKPVKRKPRSKSGAAISKAEGGVALIAVPKDGTYGSINYNGSGRRTAQIIRGAASRYLGDVSVAGVYQKLHGSLDEARSKGYKYLIYPTIQHWEDRNTVWSGSPDRVKVQLQVYDVRSRRMVESENLEKSSSSIAFSNKNPGDLLMPIMDSYFASLSNRLR